MATLVNLDSVGASVEDLGGDWSFFWCDPAAWCNSSFWCGPIAITNLEDDGAELTNLTDTGSSLSNLSGVSNTLTDLEGE